VAFDVHKGEFFGIVGRNGSGKSTLASTIMGHPKYKVTKGDISFDGQTLLNLAPDARARKGVFLAFQYPYEVPGVSLSTFLRTAYNSVRQGGKRGDLGQEMVSVLEFRKLLKEKLKPPGRLSKNGPPARTVRFTGTTIDRPGLANSVKIISAV